MNEHGQTVCLSMIVKDEAPVIRRCLDSVKALIDHWVIVDTGSSDDTREIVRAHLAGLPGELAERPWVDFAHNRSEALALARGRADYVLVIDADEVLETDPGFRLPRLEADSYNLEMRYAGCTYLRKQLVRDALPWRYEGVLHEYIHCDQARTEAFLPGIRTVPHRDGARARDPGTYRRDAEVLERALRADPGNARYAFYLAQSWRDAGEPGRALEAYRRRAAMGGWAEEVWFSLYQAAQLLERTGRPWPETMQAYLDAWEAMPDRAGPLYRVGLHHSRHGRHALANLFFSRALQIPLPGPERLFVERAVYDHFLPLEHAVSCYYVGRHAEAVDTNNRLLRHPTLPPAMVDRVIENRRFSLDARFPRPDRLHPGPLCVVVPFRDPGPELDECVEALLRQEGAAWDVVFVDDGSRAPHADRLPAGDARVTLVRTERPAGWAASVAVALRGCAADAPVLVLPPGHRLAGPGALAEVLARFGDPGSRLVYGQHRLASGVLGSAEPAPNAAGHDARGAALAGGSALAFRAGLAAEAAARDGGAGDAVSAGEVEAWAASLFAAAEFAGTRFTDAVLTVAPAIRSAAPLVLVTDVENGGGGDAELPLISALMVTRDRLALARRAIDSWAAQSWTRRELVVVSDGEPRFCRALERYVDERGIAGVRFVWEADGTPLGRLRNRSMDEARGEVLCQWDDDDCSHPERLSAQFARMRQAGARACFLSDHLHFLDEHRALLWVDWNSGSEHPEPWQMAPGTLMMYADTGVRYPEEGPWARRGEDSALLDALHARVPVAHLAGMGWLFLYTWHGRNTFPREHHLRMASFTAPTAWLLDREDEIRRALAFYPVSRPLAVIGREGPAFVLS
ncbi:MAG TPA: glycosyltransferase [Longimicrobium sp.]|nr:glycosyltransferase [Longimicrobium sp.]